MGRAFSRAGFFVAAALVASASGSESAQYIDFNRDIRPLLSDRCFACHGPDAADRQAELRLDREEGAKEWVIVPGRPEESELIARITSRDPEIAMPPPDSGKLLATEEIERLRQWVAAGAPWAEHWAYVPPQRHPTPSVRHLSVEDSEASSWARNWIDAFVLAQLEARKLLPSADAKPHELIRRLSFDLRGLPPSPREVSDFIRDPSEQAYDALVDRFLDSPAFAERMTMYWLDLVRYADTVGYHGDQDHSISPYRDWVIDAFETNLPFDDFTRRQLAGDLIADRNKSDLSETEATDLRIASGYNRLLQTSHEGGVQIKEYLTIYQADRIRNLSAVWLGATVGCAQCHDHKYDPYTARDFYSLAAVFSDIDDLRSFKGDNALPTRRDPELLVLTRRDRQRKADLRSRMEAAERRGDQAELASLQAQLDRIQPRRTMVTAAIAPREIRLLPRGDWLDESGPIMEARLPQFLPQPPNSGRRIDRLDLANWLVDGDPSRGVGGLTARVQVNRLWYLMFGAGLARVLDDFGGQGEPPSHPRLLDRLAVEFIESGWDVKAMLRTIARSRTYRQTSHVSPERRSVDPENRWLARQQRFRLPAELIRDNVLAVSGLLVEQVGGASVRPYQPEGYYQHLNFPTRVYHHDTDQQQWRRGLYVHWQRQFLHPMLRAFDAPRREECTAQRARSNTPLAALTMLNDPSVVEAARVFAARILQEGGPSDADKIEFAYRVAVARSPLPAETQVLQALLEKHRRQYEHAPEAAQRLVSVGQAARPTEIASSELAAWTSVARTLFNLDEFLTRS